MLNTCAELFTNNLDSKGLNYESCIDSDGDSLIQFPYGGKSTKMFFSGEKGTYLSLYLVYEHVPDEKVADVIFACNSFNSDYKWVKFYVDRDNDLVLQDDAILSVDDPGEEAFELLIRMVKLSEDLKPQIMKAIYA